MRMFELIYNEAKDAVTISSPPNFVFTFVSKQENNFSRV